MSHTKTAAGPKVNLAPETPCESEDALGDVVYGTVANLGVLCDADTGVQLAEPGERVLLHYPQRVADSQVRMRLKRADPDTAQLSYHWVTVYRLDTDTRYINQFNTVP